MGKRLLAFATLASGILFGCGTGKQAETDVRALRYSVPPIHGWASISWERRDSVAIDSEVLSTYERWLSDPELLPPGADTATLVWWLGESGDPKYAPTFAQFSSAANREDLFTAAVYGLARTASNPISRNELQSLVNGTLLPDRLRSSLAVVLMYVGDEPSRAMLRVMERTDLGPGLKEAITEVLDSPAGGRGRWPCPEPLIFAKGADGVFSCRNPQ
jgi:hypothetical protein